MAEAITCIALTSAFVLESSLALILLPPSYNDICDYIGSTQVFPAVKPEQGVPHKLGVGECCPSPAGPRPGEGSNSVSAPWGSGRNCPGLQRRPPSAKKAGGHSEVSQREERIRPETPPSPRASSSSAATGALEGSRTLRSVPAQSLLPAGGFLHPPGRGRRRGSGGLRGKWEVLGTARGGRWWSRWLASLEAEGTRSGKSRVRKGEAGLGLGRLRVGVGDAEGLGWGRVCRCGGGSAAPAADAVGETPSRPHCEQRFRVNLARMWSGRILPTRLLSALPSSVGGRREPRVSGGRVSGLAPEVRSRAAPSAGRAAPQRQTKTGLTH
ncbi:uncharacterized protein [Macaca fascicularis]|uniref:uncharacterized protein n=1 Tax=Macaca fascicularis TaxID=9541 RepID=UPI0032B041EB